MGITGLLPALEHTKVPVSLNQLSGKRVAVDGHCWLHNSLTCCAFELEMGIKTEKYITSFRNKLVQLIDCGVIPVVVFDGKGLPLKAYTAEQRKQKRDIARQKGHAFMKKGDRKAAYEEFKKSARITPEMISDVIKMLDGYKVEHIMAPYEADPQLAYLCKSGHVDAVLTMDSDLLVFGCPHIIFQRYGFDQLYYIQFDSLFTTSPSKSSSNRLDLTGCNPTSFRHLCILSGCDYLESLPRMGLKTAYRYMIGGNSVERAVISHIGRGEKKEEYMKRFKLANAGFLHQVVYCPKSKSYKRLTPLSESDALAITHKELDLLGVIPDISKSCNDDNAVVPGYDAGTVDSKEKEREAVITINSDEEDEEEEICPSLSTTKEDDDEEEEDDSLSTPMESKLPLSTISTTATATATATVIDLTIVSSSSTPSKQSVTVDSDTNTNKTVEATTTTTPTATQKHNTLHDLTNIKTSASTKTSYSMIETLKRNSSTSTNANTNTNSNSNSYSMIETLKRNSSINANTNANSNSNSNTNTFKNITAQELVNSFQKKSSSSFIRQKSVFGSLKRIQSSNKSNSQTRLDTFFSIQQNQAKKIKLDHNENKVE